LRDRFGHFDAIQSGHLDVEEDDVGLVLSNCVPRFGSVAALGDQIAFMSRRHHAAQTLAGEWLVVGDDNGVPPAHAATEARLSGISTIINLEKVDRLTPQGHGEYTVTLRNGARLATSRTYAARLQSILK
ncbi:MAG TPA: LytTR family DNA-binding domain-containing protein, partial [Gemmatimonadaceae bacterium]|nr:LytTR family DNA-binding domain-containing protein [Gemmatimonadaceae bacterium]